MKNGCSYGMVTRTMVEDIKSDVKEIKQACVNLSNHYSKRVPAWFTIIIGILTSIIGFVIALKI